MEVKEELKARKANYTKRYTEKLKLHLSLHPEEAIKYKDKRNEQAKRSRAKRKTYIESHPEEREKMLVAHRQVVKRYEERQKIKSVHHPEITDRRRKHRLQSACKPESRYLFSKRRARERNLEFTISLTEYINLISEPCFYCGGTFPSPKYGTGLDRIENNLGYIAGNCCSCCKTCNMLKGSVFTQAEAKIAVQAILAYRSSTA